MPYLTVVSAKDNARTFPIGTGSLTVGSDPGCDLVFPGLHLAPVHARICAEGGAYTVARAVSDAVVYLNYLPVTEKELAAGDEITLGRLCLRFEDSAEESAAAVRDMVKIVSEDSLATTVESELPSAEAEEPPESAAGRPAEFLEALYRVGSIVNAIHDPERLVDELVELLLEVTRASRACFLVPAGKGEFVPRAAAGIAGEKEGAMISRSIVGRVARGRRGILCSNASTDDRFKNATSISLGNIRSAICVPVSWKEDDLGILYLDARGFTRDFISFSEADLRLVRAIADQAALALANARRENDLVRENTTLRRRQQQLQFGMVSASPRMNQVLDVISRAAPTAATVLIRGETGTGKEVVARAIHFNSPRADRPLVTVNCAAFPETLLQSELFGHEKGAFTGAAGRKIGKFELAQGGTVFLDEIAELDPKSQVVLLRILESRILQRLG
ncbi:MAG TPA: sigma 54-interacting transcriptional regulator, partial [bacterium]|nr:sigma 54-interacting transcriptional regulator [bacterium]